LFQLIKDVLGLVLFLLLLIIKELYYAVFRTRPRKRIVGERVLITGTAQGMGALYAQRFAEMGNIVHCVDMQHKLNADVVANITAAGHTAFAYTCDITDWAAVQALKEEIHANCAEDVTYVINNAGIVQGKPWLELSPEQIERTLRVNTLSQFYVTKTFLPSILAKNHGHIVNIASVAGIFVIQNLTDYCASKFASIGFSQCLQQQFVGTNVHCTVICPSHTLSGMFDGLYMRFQGLMPSLTTEQVVDRAILAIRENRDFLVTPSVFYYLQLLAGVTPKPFTDEICRFLGTANCMNNFNGHVNNEYTGDTRQ